MQHVFLLVLALIAGNWAQPQSILLASQGLPPAQILNASLSMPAWTLRDGSTSAQPITLVPAFSFSVPSGFACDQFVLSAGLLRFYGLTAGTFRVPLNTTVWIWARDTPTALSDAAYTAVLASPDLPGWTVRTISGAGSAGYERGVYRFTLPARPNGAVFASGPYWLALSVGVNATSVTDASNNTVRWLVSNAATLSRTPYVFRDAYANGPALLHRVLGNWTAASTAEPLLMPSLISSAAASSSHALVASMLGTCTAVSSSPSPSPSSSPSPSLPASLNSPVIFTDPSPEVFPVLVPEPVPSPDPSLAPAPAPVPAPDPAPIPSPVLNPSPRPALIPSPSPILVSLPPVIVPSTEIVAPSPSPNPSVQNVTVDNTTTNNNNINTPPEPELKISSMAWFGLGIATGGTVLALLVAVLWCYVRVKRRQVQQHQHLLVRRVDREATESYFGVATRGPAAGSESSDVELSTITTEADALGALPRFRDKPDEIIENYDASMMQAVPLDAPRRTLSSSGGIGSLNKSASLPRRHSSSSLGSPRTLTSKKK